MNICYIPKSDLSGVFFLVVFFIVFGRHGYVLSLTIFAIGMEACFIDVASLFTNDRPHWL